MRKIGIQIIVGLVIVFGLLLVGNLMFAFGTVSEDEVHVETNWG